MTHSEQKPIAKPVTEAVGFEQQFCGFDDFTIQATLPRPDPLGSVLVEVGTILAWKCWLVSGTGNAFIWKVTSFSFFQVYII